MTKTGAVLFLNQKKTTKVGTTATSLRMHIGYVNRLPIFPKGKISTYKQIANRLNTKAYRAVGNAMAKNPNPIIVPCHRVIKSDGHIGGYALGIKKKIRIRLTYILY